MRHISVSLRRATKAKTEVHELQNYRHARHNLKSYSAENKYISTERSVTASQHPHFDAAKLQIFSDTSKSDLMLQFSKSVYQVINDALRKWFVQ